MDIQQGRAIIGQGDSCKAIFCALLADVRPYLLHLVGREKEKRDVRKWLDTASVWSSFLLKKMSMLKTGMGGNTQDFPEHLLVQASGAGLGG